MSIISFYYGTFEAMLKAEKISFWWYIYLAFFFGLVLFNLDRVPVAWLDETFGLDPAINLVRTGSYTSKIWAHPGTEEKFLAYMPFIQLYNAFFQWVLPPVMYWVRLPYMLAFVVALVFLWKIYRRHFNLSLLASVLLTGIFMNDQGIYESLRSFRSEVLELMLMAPAIYYFLQNKRPVLVSLLLSLLFLTHPSLWVWLGIVMLYVFFRADIKTKVWVSVVFTLPVLAFLAYAEFDIALIKSQLIDHGEEHMAKGNLLIDHFWTRYWPYYKLQPWVPLLNLFITGYCVYTVAKTRSIKNYPLEVAFLFSSLYWLFILAPLYRYNTPNILLCFVLLPKPLLLLKEKYYTPVNARQWRRGLAVFLLLISPLVLLPFASRNLAATVQREERNPQKAINWLDKQLDHNKKILLVENSIAHYYKLQHDNVDFALVYSVYKYDFNAYDEVYLVSVNDSPVPEAPLVATYEPQKGLLFGKDITRGAVTYYGLKLYKIQTAKQLKGLQRGYEQYAEGK